MRTDVRAAVAAISLSHSLNRKVSSVFGYRGEGWINVEIEVRGKRVDGYDYTNSCHIDGDIPDLYHYGQSAHIEFKPLGNNHYEGFDYGTSSHFEVKVQGQEAEVYDYGCGGYFEYAL